MKLKHIALLILASLTLGACDDMLDVTPKNIINDDQVFGSESGIRSYFATLYANMPIEDFRFGRTGFDVKGNQTYLTHVSGESVSGDDISTIGDGTWWGAWDYGRIRRVNYFMETLPEYRSKYTEGQYNAWMGEAHYIRAYYYFAMVKRYGGVPILKSTQDWTGEVETLKVPRNTEKDCYDFIAEDLNLAAGYMQKGADILGTDGYSGRANEYAAYALKSRVMLYAGTIARYGTVNLDGVVGINASEADAYFERAYEAAKKVIDSENYSLYRKNTDKAKNYSELFLAEDSPENIFIKSYQLNVNAHSWDIYCVPYQYRGTGYSSSINPTLKFVELFEYTDGSPASLTHRIEGKKFDDPADLFTDMDARFAGSIIYPNAIFKGTVCTIQKGLVKEDGTLLESAVDETTTYTSNSGKEYFVVGKSGIGKYAGNMTGFIIRKYLDESLDQSNVKEEYSTQHWIDIRLAEVYLNAAEAAAELGKQPYKTEALAWMNDLRDRAGVPLWQEADMTVNNIRNERRKELAFENHAYWDIRRWRTADKLFELTRFTGLFPYLDVSDEKYIFKTGYVNNYYYTFDPKMYYERIPETERAKNEKLVQNPYYN